MFVEVFLLILGFAATQWLYNVISIHKTSSHENDQDKCNMLSIAQILLTTVLRNKTVG